MLARIRRHGRMWGALALRSPGADYHWDARQALSSIGALANELIDRIDQERVREVRARVDRKVLEQSQPKHLFYEILHGLRSLTAYDHSAALLTYDAESDVLEVVAEQVAWQKAKGRNVGRTLAPAGPLRGLLCEGPRLRVRPRGPPLDRLDRHRRDGPGRAARLRPAGGPRHATRGGDPLRPPGRPLWAARHPQGRRHHAPGLRPVRGRPGRPVPPPGGRGAAELAAGRVARAEGLAAERKHAMADLARGVSHDVNNALGGVLPLVQQLRAELGRGELDPAVAAEDLGEIERSIQACRRIFGGMLGFARGLARNPSEVSLRQAVDRALAILRQGIERRGVRLVVELPDDLPPVTGVQADLDQLLLNLLSNARDATHAGDTVTIRAARVGDSLELVVEDTGCGIPREHLARIQEPFFTTKADGHGLGLAICRSIVAEMQGHLRIESAPGSGTRVRASFPIREEVGS